MAHTPPVTGAAQTGPSVTEIDLKDPALAAVLAWLIPGLGHWYQGRRSKAALFSICILSTFIYGLYLGEGRVVYASWRPTDRRLPYLCQVGVGLPALPAMVQAVRKSPIKFPVVERFMVPPTINARHNDSELDKLHKRLHRFWELGTVYTMIAGLLNMLVIYDAWAGPAYAERQTGRKPDDDPQEPPSGGKSADDEPGREGGAERTS